MLTVSDFQILIKSCSIESRKDPSPKSEVVHETKVSLKISYSTKCTNFLEVSARFAVSFEFMLNTLYKLVSDLTHLEPVFLCHLIASELLLLIAKMIGKLSLPADTKF